jgi:tripartite-type tricarboxylate transporter receptor subunit TctC
MNRYLALVLLLTSFVASAQDSKPLHIVVPFPAGGSQDVIARYLGNHLTARLGVPVVVENKTGAGGLIAADSVAKAAPDGKTVLLATGGAITVAPHLNHKLPYDPKQDFATVAMVADTPMTIAVRTQSPIQNMADLVREAKTKPNGLSYGSTGNGTISHLTGALLGQALGIQLLHVPYRGAGPALIDLISGQIDVMVTGSASIDPMVDDGKAKVLATFTASRLSGLRNPPTMTEATGIKGLEVPVWVGVLAPAKTPPALVAKLAAEIVAICKLPETQQRFKALGALPFCAGSVEFAKVVAEDSLRWGRVISQGNIKVE